MATTMRWLKGGLGFYPMVVQPSFPSGERYGFRYIFFATRTCVLVLYTYIYSLIWEKKTQACFSFITSDSLRRCH